jgi:hypothetical protein
MSPRSATDLDAERSALNGELYRSQWFAAEAGTPTWRHQDALAAAGWTPVPCHRDRLRHALGLLGRRLQEGPGRARCLRQWR